MIGGKKVMASVLALATLPAVNITGELSHKLYINEVMQSVISGEVDNLKEYPDSWVEVYNPSSSEINMNGYYIGKHNDPSKCYRISSDFKVPANGFKVIYCDKENDNNSGGGGGWPWGGGGWGSVTDLHTDFRLTNSKEGGVYLFDSSKALVDSMHLAPMPAIDVAYGRETDGSENLGYMLTPTRGKKNSGGLAASVLPSPLFSVPSMILEEAANGDKSVTVEMTIPEGLPAGARIRYTTDGSEPTKDSNLYSGPISFKKTTTLKAAIFLAGHLTPPAATRTFIFHGRKLTVPVFSLTTPKKNLYDNTIGIFTTQNNNSNNKNNWRRPVFMDYFANGEKEAEFSQWCEIRVSGAASRDNAQRSVAVYANSRFGSKDTFRAQFWPTNKPGNTRIPSFGLRASGNDFNAAHFRDGLVHMLFGLNTDVDWQAFQPAIVYINGEYYGILNIRERSNEDNIWMNYDKLEDIVIVENPQWGNSPKVGDRSLYDEFYNFINRSNSSTKLSEYASRMDIDEFSNVMIANIYMSNTDFPGNNYVVWRPSESGGKWRWMLKDVDRSFGFWYLHGDSRSRDNGSSSAQYLRWIMRNPADILTNNYDGANSDRATLSFRKLIANSDFKEMFIDRFTVYLGDFLNIGYIEGMINDIQNEMAYEMTYHKKLYGGSVSEWQTEVANMKKWTTERTPQMYKQLKDVFALNGAIATTVNLDVDDPEMFNVSINGIPLQTRQFDGTMFANRKYVLSATSVDGEYDVAGWQLDYFDKGELKSETIMTPEYTFLPKSTYTDVALNALLCETGTGVISNDFRVPEEVLYYNPQGQVSSTPFNGVNIVRRNYSDGTFSVTKEIR